MAFLKISNEEPFFIEFGIEFHSILPLNINEFIPYDFVLMGLSIWWIMFSVGRIGLWKEIAPT